MYLSSRSSSSASHKRWALTRKAPVCRSDTAHPAKSVTFRALVGDRRRRDAGAARLDHPGARCRRDVGDTVGVEYVSRVPRPPLDGLIDDLYYLEGAPPYPLLTLPPAPAALLIVNLGAPFRIRAGTDIETAEYADGCVV